MIKEIFSVDMSPAHSVTQCIAKEFQNMELNSGKNKSEFFQIRQLISELEKDEVLISFGIKVIFWSSPFKEAL